MRISQPITDFMGKEWIPVKAKMWWYGKPPAVNDLRVGLLIGIVIGLIASLIFYIILSFLA